MGLMLGVTVVADDWEFVFCVARGSEEPGIMRGMLIGGLKSLNVSGTLQQRSDWW